MPRKHVWVGLFASLLSTSFVAKAMADESVFKLEPLRATATWEGGEIENFVPYSGANPPASLHKELIGNTAVWLLQEARLTENVKVFLGIGGMYYFVTESQGNTYGSTQRSALGITDAHGEFEYWKQENGDHGLRLKVGVFPYKYNEDAKNLGEYMFRTYTYPTIMYTGGLVLLNSAGAQLNGLDANTKIGGIQNDVLLTLKTDQVPIATLSLTDIASYTFKNILTVGAGYMFDNFYDPTHVARGNTGGTKSDYYTLADGSHVLASSYNPSMGAITDTNHYSFVGQKAMIRASLDIGKIISSPMLSSHDLRLYFEAILMGVQNHPIYYDTLSNRIAYMVGLNLPTFHILDLLSVELEYCKNPYANDANTVFQDLSPTPVNSAPAHGDDVKWTIYARKTFFTRFAVTGQVARDHLRLLDYYSKLNDAEVLPNHENWYWAFQLSYSI